MSQSINPNKAIQVIANTTSTKNRPSNNRANAIQVEPLGSIPTTSNRMARVLLSQNNITKSTATRSTACLNVSISSSNRNVGSGWFCETENYSIRRTTNNNTSWSNVEWYCTIFYLFWPIFCHHIMCIIWVRLRTNRNTITTTKIFHQYCRTDLKQFYNNDMPTT